MERGESISTTGFIVVSLGSIFIGLLVGALLHKKDVEAMPKKEYPVVVRFNGEPFGNIHCDSANLNYAWKDGIRIPLKNVYDIKFN